MVRDFYASFGFEKVEETADGSTTWQLDVADVYKRQFFSYPLKYPLERPALPPRGTPSF